MADPESKTTFALVAGAVAFVALGIAFAWFITRPDVPPARLPNAPQPAVSPEETVRLVQLKNTGIAQIENEKYSDSDAAFVELANQFPGDPFGPRNLAVARLLNAGQLDPKRDGAKRGEALAKLDEALAQMRPRENDSAALHVLSARAALAAGDERRAADELTQATDRAPGDPAIWYELYATFKNSKDETLSAKSQAALKRAFKLRPNNLQLLIETLQLQARTHDAGIGKTLAAAREAVQPFAEAIKQRNRVDLELILNLALTAAQANDAKQWTDVTRNVTILANLLRPELATRLDLRRVNRHAMDYLLHDFKEPIVTALAGAPEPSPISVRFTRAPDADQSGLPSRVLNVALADFNLDGKLDVICSRDTVENSLEVYTRDDKGHFELLCSANSPVKADRILAVDLDRDYQNSPKPVPSAKANENPSKSEQLTCLDADVDLVLSGGGAVAVLRNDLDNKTGERKLEIVTQDTAFGHEKGVITTAVADVDHDGDLDILLSREAGMAIWSNRDNMTFADISNRSAFPSKEVIKPTDLVPVDWNRNIDLDVLACAPSSPAAGYLENLEHGRFRWQPFESEFTKVGGSAALAVIDADGNASWDIASVGEKGVSLTLTSTRPAESVRVIKEQSLSTEPMSGVLTWDFDNDGYQDLLAWGSGIQTFRGGPSGQFTLVADLIKDPPGLIRSCHVGDIDGDGDEDLLVVAMNQLTWFLNEGGNANHWIDIAIRAEGNPQEPSERCNIHGIGSLLELKAGPIYQARVVNGRSTHFGLGKTETPDVMRVLWTNGIPHNVIHPAVDQPICEQQQLKGSCPYLYTWTGSKYEFFTDCLWNAPIGLQFASGVLAPAREWEYLTIPGDRLVPVDGEYRMQMTEELWEATYFDQVKLIAVDHPADVQIYSNEKVGPASIAQHRIHTVRHPRAPVAARDKQGRDILPLLAKQDRNFVKAFDRRIKQGLVDDHFLELDLGDLKDANQITLFLTGWIFPTDVTINIAVDENPLLSGPKPPSLWVPDENGGWKVAIPFMGFPGGKTKTMAVDLTDLLPANDHRVQVRTSHEIYWDAAFFTVDEEPVEVREVALPLIAADLHFRGCSKRVKQPHHAPEWYDYATVETKPIWPPMLGHFTKFGDVSDLLATTDDCVAIIGAGDEMTLRFQANLDALPAGWKRDFLLYNVGWDKDADLNTVYGQTVEPLPFAGMSGYPHDPEHPYPDTPRHRDYLEQYQTREQSTHDFWHQVRDFETLTGN